MSLRFACLLLLAACGGNALPGGGDDAPGNPDGRPSGDAGSPDAALIPLPDGGDASCQPMDFDVTQACAIAWTGEVHSCSIDGTGQPSQTGWLKVTRPDGAAGYLCATQWTTDGGYAFVDDRVDLVDSSAACCGGAGSPVGWPAVDPLYGTAHGPTHVKPWEATSSPDGVLNENPFSIVVTNAGAAAAYAAAHDQWVAWAGDGQPHPAPDGSGQWWFPDPLPIQYVLVPTSDGRPMIVIAPEVSPDSGFNAPQGHPTLGACAGTGGAPLAYVGGEIHDDVISNRSGRFGHEPTITQADLENTAALFNCYGITIHSIDYVPPG
jgi:hypothetical protein